MPDCVLVNRRSFVVCSGALQLLWQNQASADPQPQGIATDKRWQKIKAGGEDLQY